MSVHFIMGRAASGKSTAVYRQIGQALAEGRQPLILLVPELYTLQAERELMEALELPGLLHVQVLSFSRLASRMGFAAGMAWTRIDRRQKAMLLRRVLDECADELLVMRALSQRQDFIEKIAEQIAQFKRYLITPAALAEWAQSMNAGILKDKLSDIQRIYQGYAMLTEQAAFQDEQDALSQWIGSIEGVRGLHEAFIWVDGFDYFPPQACMALEKLMRCCRQVNLTFTLPDADGQDAWMFEIERASLRGVEQAALRAGMEIQRTFLPGFTRDPALAHMESALFADPLRPFPFSTDNLRLIEAADPFEQARMASQLLLEQARGGLRWNEMAILCGNMDADGPMLAHVLGQAGVPCYMDTTGVLADNPGVSAVLFAMDAVLGGWTMDGVIGYLKTGFGLLDAEEIEGLENYCLAHAIRGSAWKKPFTYGEQDLSWAEPLRQRMHAPLGRLQDSLQKSKRVSAHIKAIVQLIEDLDLQSQLEQWAGCMDKQGLSALAAQGRQAYDALQEVLLQLDTLMGSHTLAPQAFLAVLQAGLDAARLGSLPSYLDQVMIGDIRHSKFTYVQSLLITSCNQDILPAPPADKELLSPIERETLAQNGMTTGFAPSLAALQETQRIYRAFARTNAQLTLLWPRADQAGAPLAPSPLIERIAALFPHNRVQTPYPLVQTPQSTFPLLIHRLAQAKGQPLDADWEGVRRWYAQHDDWRARLDQVQSLVGGYRREDILSPDLVEPLYGLRRKGAGVTRLERFARCPFAHFIQYGLRPQPRQELSVRMPDIGTFFHEVMEILTGELSCGGRWHNISQTDCQALCRQIIAGLLEQPNYRALTHGSRANAQARRFALLLERSAWAAVMQVRAGQFIPLSSEMPLGDAAVVEGVRLSGRIDRVDVMIGQDRAYVRVIDYKSGEKKLDLSSLSYGLDLQLPLYLGAALSIAAQGKPPFPKDKPVLAGGMFYFTIDTPPSQGFIQSDEQLLEALMRSTRLEGLLPAAPEVALAMDSPEGGWALPRLFNKDGSLSSRGMFVSEPAFAALAQYALQAAGRHLRGILSGDISVSPARAGKLDSCQYCELAPLCGLDMRFENGRVRAMPPRDRHKAIAHMMQEDSNAGLDR